MPMSKSTALLLETGFLCISFLIISVSSDRRSQVYLFNVGSGDSNSRHHNTGQTRYFTSCLNSPAIMNMNKTAIVELGEIFCVVDHFFFSVYVCRSEAPGGMGTGNCPQAHSLPETGK